MAKDVGWLGRENNFDGIRIAAALCVIVGHSFPLLGNPGKGPRVLGAPIENLGLFVFFTVSGFLISESWIRYPHFASYLRNRVLRIFPGLITVTILSFAVLGPVTTTLSVGDYFSNSGSWRYLLNIVLRPVFVLPGTFQETPFAGSVNGSLWTLPIEFFCYLAVPLLLCVPPQFRVLTVAAFGLGSAVFTMSMTEQIVVYGTSITRAAELWCFFAAGSLLALISRRVAARLDIAIIFILAQCLVVAIAPEIARHTLWLLLPYPLIAFCVASTPLWRRAARFGDFSYGLYIYAFPIQQLVVSYLGVLPIIVNVLVVTGITLGLAYLSWRFIEKPSLKFKSRPLRSTKSFELDLHKSAESRL